MLRCKIEEPKMGVAENSGTPKSSILIVVFFNF